MEHVAIGGRYNVACDSIGSACGSRSAHTRHKIERGDTLAARAGQA